MVVEVWKDIAGFEGYYQASNLGNIKTLARNFKPDLIKKPCLNKYTGYLQTTISINNKSRTYNIHILIAKTFIENPNGLKEVNHKDCNKTNNCIDNLEFVTAKENTQHARLNKLRDDKHGYDHPNTKNSIEILDLLGNRIGVLNGKLELKSYGFIPQLVGCVIRGDRYKTHKKCKFRYIPKQHSFMSYSPTGIYPK